MKLSDNPQAADEVERLLRNWGRWCRVPKVYIEDGRWFYRQLWYSEQPMTRDYRAPRQEQTKAPPAVVVRDAERANEAFINMRDAELQMLLAEYYANNQPAEVLSKMLDIHRTTVYRRLATAKQGFFDEFRKK